MKSFLRDVFFRTVGKSEGRDRWKLKQLLAKPGRFYGDGGTIHHTTTLDVEVAANGEVVSIWFRCQPLPFEQHFVDAERAAEMRGMYAAGGRLGLTGVEVLDE